LLLASDYTIIVVDDDKDEEKEGAKFVMVMR
jgi:hypothetical protein